MPYNYNQNKTNPFMGGNTAGNCAVRPRRNKEGNFEICSIKQSF